MIFKLLMYVLSHGCLQSSYKAFFNLHTWVFLSCVLTFGGCKCLFVVYAFFPWEALCYESFFVSHDVSIYCMMELQTSVHVSILHPRHHSSWAGFPFLLGYFFIAGRFSSMMSPHSSYYSSSWILSWTVVTCSPEQVSSFFACRWLYAIFPTSQMQ